MANSRKDHKGRKLKEGESRRSDGRYCYRYTDIMTGKRLTVYAMDLPELREKEKQIARDIEDNILTDEAIKKLTLNTLFEQYMDTRELADSTRRNYINIWNNNIKDEIGGSKVVLIRSSHVKAFYAKLSRAGYANATIKYIHNMIYAALEMAVEDDFIRKNPAKGSVSNYGRPAEERTALTKSQQEKMFAFVKEHNIYNTYHPMLTVMIGTGLRCGELIGLTWQDIDTKAKKIRIDHQLIYKNLGDGCRFHATDPKTDAGFRTIPMTQAVCKAFEKQREINFMLGKGKDFEVEGYRGFVFMAKTGRPLMPSAVNKVLYNIVDAYNKEEVKAAKKEHRKVELLPKFSAHIMRHTACTRMAEYQMDIKVLQYIMGHENIEMTMEVYNHLSDSERIEKEMAKLDNMAMNF